jgi:hypothetical protein
LYAMRIMSALLTAFMLTTMFVALLAQSRSWWPAVAGCVGITPTVLFLGGVVNPNAVEMASAGALLSVITLILRRELTRATLWSFASLAIVSAFLLLGGRSLALAWLAVIGVASVILVPWQRITELLKRPAILYMVAGIAAAAIWMVLWFSFSVVPVDPSGQVAHRAPGLVMVTKIMLEATFQSWSSWIGQFGWLDYIAPSGIQILWGSSIAALFFLATIFSRGRTRALLIFFFLVTVITPVAVQVALYNEVGWLWQGRYLLAMYLCTLIVAGIALDQRFSELSQPHARRIVRAGATLLAIGQVAAIVFVLRRYVVTNQSWKSMLTAPLWQPPGSWILLALLTALVSALAVILIFRWTREPRPDVEVQLSGD